MLRKKRVDATWPVRWNMKHRLSAIGLLLALTLPVWADDSSSPKSASERPAKNTAKEERPPAFTPEREAAALSFVRQHHPELGDLLSQLKTGNRNEYRRVINELFVTSERLALSQERDPAKYELDLRIWKIDSRIRLLAARLAMSDSELLQGELKDLLLEKQDVQLEQQMLERQRITTRLERLDAAIERVRSHRESEAQKALAKVLQEVQETGSKARSIKKPTATKASNESASKTK